MNSRLTVSAAVATVLALASPAVLAEPLYDAAPWMVERLKGSSADDGRCLVRSEAENATVLQVAEVKPLEGSETVRGGVLMRPVEATISSDRETRKGKLAVDGRDLQDATIVLSRSGEEVRANAILSDLGPVLVPLAKGNTVSLKLDDGTVLATASLKGSAKALVPFAECRSRT